MLRLLVAALVVANLVFFGWSRGWLDGLIGIPATGERDPRRLVNQVRPESIRLWPDASGPVVASVQVNAASGSAAAASAANGPASAARQADAGPAAAASASAASSPPVTATHSAAMPADSAAAVTACFEAGPFNPADLRAALISLKGQLPDGTWTERQLPGSGEWMILMGPYPDRDWVERKKAELGRIRGGVPHEELTNPIGLSLGRFPTQAAAEGTLAQYRQRGIRTARVLRAGDGPPRTFLRIARADADLVARLTTLKLQPPGRSFTPCPAPP